VEKKTYQQKVAEKAARLRRRVERRVKELVRRGQIFQVVREGR